MDVRLEDVQIRNDLKPGDIGYVSLHGILYGGEYGYGIGFETYVAAGLHEFYQAYDPGTGPCLDLRARRADGRVPAAHASRR